MTDHATPATQDGTRLLVGPLLRYVDDTRATIWVETSGACTVHVTAGEVTGSAATWEVFGHHFALVQLDGLALGTATEYSVDLEVAGATARVWPENSERPSVIRTLGGAKPIRLAFGSCRRGEQQSPRMLRRIGADALVAMSHQMGGTDCEQWPDAMLLLGDQIYADIPSEAIAERLAERRKAGLGPQSVRDSAGSGGDRDVSAEICDFEEYSWLYAESWQDPDVRWLMSTVPSCMILDDHDLRDDWNSSYSWREEMTAQPWWRDRVVGAFASYFVYQHLGNLSPRELAADETYQGLLTAGSASERESLLTSFAIKTDATPGTSRWSYRRDFGRVRVVMLDVRASRHLDPESRAVMDPQEWEWVRRTCLEADVDHLLLGSSLPAFMVPALHHIEGWNEKVAYYNNPDRVAARVGEWIRRTVDLEHWAAFRRSFDALVQLLGEVARGEGAGWPASILLLGGDVHCSYLEEVELGASELRGAASSGAAAAASQIHQLVMSPYRNPLEKAIRVVNRIAVLRPIVAVMRLLARSVGVKDPDVTWRVSDGIWFDNGVMTLVLDGRSAEVEVDHAAVEWPWRGLGRYATYVPGLVSRTWGRNQTGDAKEKPRQVLRRTLSKKLA